MNILEALVGAGDGAAVRQLGSQVGLGEEQTASALSALVPALAAGFQRNLQSGQRLASMAPAHAPGGHQQYIDSPATLGDQRAVADGNGILAQVLGSKEASREVAGRAAAQTGLSAEVMKRMLPLVATMMMGALAKRSGGASAPGSSGGGIAAMLTPLLDGNRDGSIVDDVGGMIGKYFKG